jgi:putative spermidine/putrescine transport system ATP-binding protein
MMLAGFEGPSAGDILYAGRSITALPPHKRNFGMVFQGYALFPHMSVLDNVSYPLRMRRVRGAEAESRARRALELVQLTGYGHRHPSELSGGQQQRVALARALVFDPFVVLMDEPLGALDKNLREHLQLEIRHLHERLNNTILYVTHDQSEALTLSDRIAVFHEGVLQQVATPEELYRRPANSFVAQFIGENNQLHGTVVEVAARECLVRLDSGQQVTATPGRHARPGSRTTISLRPERLSVNATGGEQLNRLEGTVLEMIYLGDHHRYRVDVATNANFIIKLPATESESLLTRGEVIQVSWSSRDCLALDPLSPA